MEMTWQGMHVSITTNLSHLIQGIASQKRYAVGNPFLVGGLWTTLLWMVACGQPSCGWWLVDKPWMLSCRQALEWWPVDKPWNGDLRTSLGWWPVDKPWNGGL